MHCKLQAGVHEWIPACGDIHHQDWECNHSTTQTLHTQHGIFITKHETQREGRNAEQEGLGSRDATRPSSRGQWSQSYKFATGTTVFTLPFLFFPCRFAGLQHSVKTKQI